jgi:hypothetical protein
MLFAQFSLKPDLNLPRAGDELFKQQVEYKDPGRSGANVLWDFSRLNVINDEYELIYSTPNDTVITGMEHFTQYHYVFQNDSLLLLGFDNQTTNLHNVKPEVLLKFPFNHGDTINDYYYAHGQYGNRMELDMMGTVQIVGDAYGMMVLPNKDTLKHVVRLRTIKYIAENMVPITESYYEKLQSPLTISLDSITRRLETDTVLFVMETFRWYEEGYRYPVFETVRSWQQCRNTKDYTFLNTAFFYPPQDHYYLETDPENQMIVEAKNKGKNSYNPLVETAFNAYPNPMSTMLNVEILLPVEAKIKIQIRSIANNSVYINENKGKFASGGHRFQFDVSRLPFGYYLLNIWVDNYLLSETMLKQ